MRGRTNLKNMIDISNGRAVFTHYHSHML